MKKKNRMKIIKADPAEGIRVIFLWCDLDPTGINGIQENAF